MLGDDILFKFQSLYNNFTHIEVAIQNYSYLKQRREN